MTNFPLYRDLFLKNQEHNLKDVHHKLSFFYNKHNLLHNAIFCTITYLWQDFNQKTFFLQHKKKKLIINIVSTKKRFLNGGSWQGKRALEYKCIWINTKKPLTIMGITWLVHRLFDITFFVILSIYIYEVGGTYGPMYPIIFFITNSMHCLM